MAYNGYEPTQAQETMRKEMSIIHVVDKEMSISEVVDEAVGKSNHTGQPELNVSGLALDIINEGGTLTLSMAQWQTVQNMIEQGILVGVRHGQ